MRPQQVRNSFYMSAKIRNKNCPSRRRKYFTFSQILGAFLKIAKSYHYLHVRLSAWSNSAPTGRIFNKFYI